MITKKKVLRNFPAEKQLPAEFLIFEKKKIDFYLKKRLKVLCMM